MRTAKTSDACINMRINGELKKRAARVYADLGLSLSDAIRIFLTRSAKDKCFPFELKEPNDDTLEAMAELKAGKGRKAASIKELMFNLHAQD